MCRLHTHFSEYLHDLVLQDHFLVPFPAQFIHSFCIFISDFLIQELLLKINYLKIYNLHYMF